MSSPINIRSSTNPYQDADSLSDASTVSSSPPNLDDPILNPLERDPEAVIMNVFLMNKLDKFLIQFCDNSSEELKWALSKSKPKHLFEVPSDHILRICHADFLTVLFRKTHRCKYEQLITLPEEYSLQMFARLALYRLFNPFEYRQPFEIPEPHRVDIRLVRIHKSLIDGTHIIHPLPPRPCNTSKLIRAILHEVTPPALELFRGAVELLERACPPRRPEATYVFKSMK